MLALALEGIHITLVDAPLLSVDTAIAPGEVLTVMVTHGADGGRVIELRQ